MFIRKKKVGEYTYLQIVKNVRVDGKVSQRLLCNLGRIDDLQKTGKLDALLISGAKFSEELSILGAFNNKEIPADSHNLHIGPSLLFEKLWQELHIPTVLHRVAQSRRFEFPIERAVFMTVLHRLFDPGSDRAADKWKELYKIDNCDNLDLQHLYRTMGWLGSLVPMKKQDPDNAELFRYVKDIIEEELFFMTNDLFTDLQLVFFDTTSLYFEGTVFSFLRRHGHSKDHRPDLHQIIVGVVLDNKGNPICSEILPGNTADVKTLVPVAERLKKRFGIEKVCIVADRGMISREVMEKIEEMGWHYILGVRMRINNEAANDVLTDQHNYKVITPPRKLSHDPSPLKVKEVIIDDKRYIVCHNCEQAEKDRYDREKIIEALRNSLKQGDKSLIGNKGYRKYIKSSGARFEIDEDKIQEEEKFDGTWILQTNTDLSMETVALKYKDLWMVENVFRTMKSTLATRPIHHKCDETIMGHVFCSFLALKLRKLLQDKIDQRGWVLEWADIIHDVNELCEVELIYNGKKLLIRTDVKGVAGKVFQAARIALSPVLRPSEKVVTTPEPHR